MAKVKHPPLGSAPASPEVAEALRKLINIRNAQAALKAAAVELRSAIMKGGGGSAYGYRSYVSHVNASTYVRYVKAHDELKIVAIGVATKK